MRKSRKLLVLSGFLGLVIAAASARPALALCYICVQTDPCTETEVFGNSVCCARGHGPTCTVTSQNGCIVSVTTGCA